MLYTVRMSACHHTQSGYSALMTAAENGHTEVVVELLKARANVDLQDTVCVP